MKNYSLDVPAPVSLSYVTRNIPEVSVEQRERALKATHYNEFAFPAGLLTVDMLSDSGTTSMTDVQWSAMFLGDESYGRNKGYYVLLDAFRDIFERGGEKNWKRSIDLVRTDCRDMDRMIDELYLAEYEGGFFNGGAAQLERVYNTAGPCGRIGAYGDRKERSDAALSGKGVHHPLKRALRHDRGQHKADGLRAAQSL